jgi:phosphoacetylglucosamine mutase
VGAPKAAALGVALVAALGEAAAPRLRLLNTPGDGGELNGGCGAEFVQKARRPPRSFDSAAMAAATGGRAASLDGDADRIVFHYWRADGSWALLDGDKIAALIAGFVVEHLDAALGALQPTGGHLDAALGALQPTGGHLDAAVGALQPTSGRGGDGGDGDGAGLGVAPAAALSAAVVQTAYANGASTAYLRAQGRGSAGGRASASAHALSLVFAKTGVKYLHHAALRFDLAVYFEANGHGALLFSQPLLHALHALSARPPPADGAEAARLERAQASCAVLLACHQLVNQVRACVRATGQGGRV